MPPAADSTAPLFRGRRPPELAFGTSGLRGRVDDITDLEVLVNVRGFLDHLAASAGLSGDRRVALAGDLRPSTDSPGRSIMRAVARGVAAAGLEPVNLGRIPTPALTAYAMQRGWPGIMVTGSHIPFDRNGIKFNSPRGEVLKSDEAAILACVERVRREEYDRPPKASIFDDDGMFRPGEDGRLPPPLDAGNRSYVQRFLEFFPADALSGLAIVVYEHSAVGREILADVLRGLGARVHAAGRSATFVPVDTEAISNEQLHTLQRLADEGRDALGSVDAVISTDGDSDRPLVAGIDRRGKVRFFPGDALGILVAETLRADAAAVPVSATDAVEKHLGPGVEILRTRIGSPWVIAGMSRLSGSRRVGWEANGGFLTGTDLELDGRTLTALPTRDAVLPIVCVLRAASARRLTPVELFDTLPRRITRAGLIDTASAEVGRAILRQFSPGAGVRAVAYGDNTMHCSDEEGQAIDPSPGQKRRLEAIRSDLDAVMGAALGAGAVRQVDFLDGIRVYLDDGEIVHVRPSGNAPQLRVYAVAGSEERAAAIVRRATVAPGGLLHRLVAGADPRPGF